MDVVFTQLLNINECVISINYRYRMKHLIFEQIFRVKSLFKKKKLNKKNNLRSMFSELILYGDNTTNCQNEVNTK